MENPRNCVMRRRGLYRRRYQQHVLSPHLPRERPEIAAYIQQHAVLKVAFDNTRMVCHRCWQRIDNIVVELNIVPEPEIVQEPNVVREPNVDEEPNMQEPIQMLHVPEYRRAFNNPRECVFNNCINGTRHRIPAVHKLRMLCDHNLYIPNGARVCREHLIGNHWDELPEFCNLTNLFTAVQFSDICDILRTAIKRKARLDFSVPGAMSNTDMHFYTGHNGDQFEAILEQTPLLTERYNKPRTALGIYITKLRTGDSNERLATLFDMSRRNLERLLAVSRECLKEEYVDRHLGFDHVYRHNILERNLTVPKALFGNEENSKVIIICDGTYIYIQKSSNFLFQRQSYSLHKYQNLLKPFLMVATDGYIIDVKGPYAASKTDAHIMSDLMNDEENAIHVFLEPNDIFILDRGFRDSLGDIEACGYNYFIPATKNRHETQLSTEQENDSRAVTMCRWVVEVVNGRFKRDFKLLRRKYFNRSLPNMFTDFKIAAAFLNHFHEPIQDNMHAEEFLNRIREKVDLPNLLFNYVERKRLNNRRAAFQRIEVNDVENFPRLTENEIIILALGTYQLKLARSYCAEHINDGLYLIEIYRENEIDDLPDYGINEEVSLLRGRIQSRHIRARIYYCYILYNGGDIVQHYCTCLTGRTMGTCAHIVSIIWYIAYARHVGFNAPAMFLNDVILDDL